MQNYLTVKRALIFVAIIIVLGATFYNIKDFAAPPCGSCAAAYFEP